MGRVPEQASGCGRDAVAAAAVAREPAFRPQHRHDTGRSRSEQRYAVAPTAARTRGRHSTQGKEMGRRLAGGIARRALARADERAALRCNVALAVALALGAAGCAQVRPYVPPSEGHISARPAPAPDAAIPPPARV